MRGSAGWRNTKRLELRFYDPTDELIATEYLSPTRALEIAGRLIRAAHDALKAGILADEVRRYADD